MTRIATFLLLLAATTITASGQPSAGDDQNWPRWRGPQATGVAPQGNPPTEWSEEKNIRWKVAIPGGGSASPIVWGDKLFLLTAVEAGERAAQSEGQADTVPVAFQPPEGRGRRGGPDGGRGGRGGFGGGEAPSTPYEFTILCLDRNTGKMLWKQVARKAVPHERGHETNTFASASPITDGKFLYASFGSYGIYCYDLDGKKIWETDLGDMQTRNAFGEGATPALYGDTLVVPWDHEGPSFVAALDAKTGKEKWRVDRDEVTSWSTPLIVPRGNGHQVIVNATNRVRSYDLKTGEVLWECGGQTTNAIPTPVANDELVFVTSGFRGQALYAIPLDATGDLTGTDKIAWKRDDGTPYISSPTLVNGRLYLTKERNAILACIEAETGKELYKNQRLPEMNTLYSSPVAAADRVYFFSREGTGVVLKEGDKFEVLAVNRLDETVDATPAIVGNVMYVRGNKSLYCIAEK